MKWLKDKMCQQENLKLQVMGKALEDLGTKYNIVKNTALEMLKKEGVSQRRKKVIQYLERN